MAASDAPTRPLGQTPGSLPGIGWPVDELEHIPDLTWPTSVPTLAKMRTDPTITSILAAYTTPLEAADWRVDPQGATPEACRVVADSLGIRILGDQEQGPVNARFVKWREHVRLAALHLVFGHMPFEPVYQVVDGKAYLETLPERMPNTIAEIHSDKQGALKSIKQVRFTEAGTSLAPEPPPIPADRLLWYVHGREGAAWQGRSLLRAAYAPWLLKLEAIRSNATGIRRWNAGVPVAEPLPGTNPTIAQIREAQQMVSQMRGGDRAGAVPVGFTVKIVGLSGQVPDALPTIRYYDEQMARAALTSLLDLGSTANGSRALGDNFADVFTRALQGVGDGMAETASQLAVRLTTFNFGDNAVAPRVVVPDVGASKATIAASITSLVQSGALTADPALDEYVRDAYNLPAAKPVQTVASPTAVPPGPVEPGQGDPVQVDVELAAAGGLDRNRGDAEKLRRYWTRGAGAAKIRWGTSGDFDRCVSFLSEHMTPENAKGYCANRHKEVTGQWPGAGRVHAAEGLVEVRAATDDMAEPRDPGMPARTYRPRTIAEIESGIDPEQIDQQHDDLVAEGVALLGPAFAAWAAALTPALVAALGASSLVGLARLTIPPAAVRGAVDDLQLIMSEAAEAGVGQVIREAGSQGEQVDRAKVRLDDDALRDRAETLAELAAQEFAVAVGREAGRIHTPDTPADDTAEKAIATVLGRTTPVPNLANEAVTEGMGSGRLVAGSMLTGAWTWFHSAIRDQATCHGEEPPGCWEHDQHEYASREAGRRDFAFGYFKHCRGRFRCRCILAARKAEPEPEAQS